MRISALLHGHLPADNARMSEHDIVIAGGGIAGLYCARRLAGAGHQVLVLETASDR